MQKNRIISPHKAEVIFLLLFSVTSGLVFAGPGDFNIDGTFEAALDIPRILFLLKREPNGPPLEYMGEFTLNWAFLDTGASGVLMSRETVDALEISIDPNAQYADIGIGGLEYFDVSEPLYIATTDYCDTDPYNLSHYFLTRYGRFQVSQHYAGPWPDEPLDILGIPVMAGKTVVLNAGAPNRLEYFSAAVTEPDDPNIPEVDFIVPLRFEKYIVPKLPLNIPPLPVLGYNPVIDNITAEYNGNSSTGTWLFDTGATISFMSSAQAVELGLIDTNGNLLAPLDFVLPVGGIGGQTNIPGFKIDNLIIPTLNGYSLIFNNARIGVYDIGIIDDVTGEWIILDGVFGSNFLCASAKLVPLLLAEGAFEYVVVDLQKGLLGFDVIDTYPLPTCGDADHPQPAADITDDCKVNLLDLFFLSEYWLRDDCSFDNNFCDGADLDENEKIDLDDYRFFAQQWYESPFLSTCGDAEHPWPKADFNHDCAIDEKDLEILAREWLNDCNWLNFNCRGADLNLDHTVDVNDYIEFLKYLAGTLVN